MRLEFRTLNPALAAPAGFAGIPWGDHVQPGCHAPPRRFRCRHRVHLNRTTAALSLLRIVQFVKR